jgi:hypothetical protein
MLRRGREQKTRVGGVEFSSASMVQKKNSNASCNKKKNKQENNSKPKQTTTFKKKKNNKDAGYFVCESDEHWANSYPDRKFKQEKKSANMVISEAEEITSGYDNSLHIVLLVCHLPEWCMDTGANIHVCADAFLFSSYQVGGTGALLMGNGSHARVFSVGTVILKFTSEKNGTIEEHAACPLHKKI